MCFKQLDKLKLDILKRKFAMWKWIFAGIGAFLLGLYSMFYAAGKADEQMERVHKALSREE